jgi:hypothetical protein
MSPNVKNVNVLNGGLLILNEIPRFFPAGCLGFVTFGFLIKRILTGFSLYNLSNKAKINFILWGFSFGR